MLDANDPLWQHLNNIYMAKVYHKSHIEKVLGAHSGIIERQKVLHDFMGNITKVCQPEAYTPNKRNYKAAPIMFAEKDNMQAFGNVSHMAQEFIDAWKNDTPLPPAKQAFLDSVKQRFYKQLNGEHDPIAPCDKFGKYTIYGRPDNFLRAVLRKEHPTFDA